MPTDNNMFDPQYVYGVLQHGKTIHIGVDYKI
jgi:hypothetical protein